MSTETTKIFGTYKGLLVKGSWRKISSERLTSPLAVPSRNDNELSIWMRLAKMLAKAKHEGTWGPAEDEALGWVRELSSADPSFLKGDCAVWTFYEKFERGGKKGRTILRKQQQEEIKIKLNMGVPIARIANEHDVSRGTIYRFIENMKEH